MWYTEDVRGAWCLLPESDGRGTGDILGAFGVARDELEDEPSERSDHGGEAVCVTVPHEDIEPARGGIEGWDV